MKMLALVLTVLLTACTGSAPPASPPAASPQPAGPERPMDEVPAQQVLSGGDREYRFANGCVIVLEAEQAVVKIESASCELYHRDIALLYASGD
ncbi:hypothetical protein [Hoeflea sp.]|uniref:hypothetical protein n=1 Tax=Hoeflea sp. TaxID=1940281 RepID=UPI00199E438D|nr:hypothetical protein [Hoeflea sp.]MBC7279940.1 hypothetical protein [Hoeflea sp.]